MVVETAILQSLEPIVSGLVVHIIGHNKVVDSLHHVVGGNHWPSVGHTLAHCGQFLVLVSEHGGDLALLCLCELSHIVIVVVVVA